MAWLIESMCVLIWLLIVTINAVTWEIFSSLLQNENHLSVSKDLIADSTSVDVDIPGSESASNGGEAKPLLTDSVMQMTSSV